MLLAPMARQKKGEFAQELQMLQAQGFVRFRLNGQVLEASELPPLKKTEKHDIDVVVDRVKLPADKQSLRQRLAESFETALRLADGRAIALGMDAPATGRSRAGAAPSGGDEPAGELVAKNCSFPASSPARCAATRWPSWSRACSASTRPAVPARSARAWARSLGFDAARVVSFPSLSLASGAVKGWDRRNPYTFGLLEGVARHYGFDIETAFESLAAEHQRVLLYGSGETEVEFVYVSESASGRKRSVKRAHPFEGILVNLERRWRETDSTAVREDLSRYQCAQPCPHCAGTRLRREARHRAPGGPTQRCKAWPSTRSSA
jgi:excinuclease ABC subunit A